VFEIANTRNFPRIAAIALLQLGIIEMKLIILTKQWAILLNLCKF